MTYFPLGVISPRVDTGIFFTGHGVAPPGVCHIFPLCRKSKTFPLEANVSQAFYKECVREANF